MTLSLVQVCDDSTKEEVRKKVDAAVIAAIEKGHQVQLIRRDNRQGYKAGAMVEGMARVAGQGYDYVAIFDAGARPTRARCCGCCAVGHLCQVLLLAAGSTPCRGPRPGAAAGALPGP